MDFTEFLGSLIQNLVEHKRWLMFLRGLSITLYISFGATILGSIIGPFIAFSAMSNTKILRFISNIYIDVIRGTPVIIQLLIINFTLFSGIRNAGIWVGMVTLGINSGAYIAEIIRSGILSIDNGQFEAGRSLGFNKIQTLRYIIAPQALKNVLPSLVNESIVLIKETAIVGYIAVEDLTKVSQLIMVRTVSVTPLFVSAFLYFIVIKILTILLKKFEAKLRASDNR
jgi:arginine/lysine/histidine transport system permease protein